MKNNGAKAKRSVCFVCVAFFLFSASCAKHVPQGQTSDVSGESSAPSVAPAQAATYQRIVSCAPSNTEILVGLGLGERLIAVDTFSRDIDGIPSDVVFFDGAHPDVEKLITLSPDIVVAHEMNKGADTDPFSPLEKAGVAVVYVAMSNTIESIYGDILFLAHLFEVNERGAEMVASMKHDVDAIAAIAATIQARRSVYFELEAPPMMTSFGRGVFLDEMLRCVGAINIFEDARGFVYPDTEQLVVRNPDVILTNVSYLPNMVDAIMKRTGFAYISAVHNKRVYQIDTNSSSRQSQHIVKALREMARDIYPEYYADVK